MLVASVPLSRGSIRRNSPHAIQITKREGEMGQQKERCMLQCSLKMYQWYRCKIMQKIDDGKSHVQYLDYVATLRKQHISQAWCALLRSLPSSLWSFFCGFHGLQSLKRDNHRAFYDKKAENSQVENETPKTPETLCRMSLGIGEPARLVALSI
nr:uncharacterized protein LOC119178475 isoform X5 [Rhipicephalus microplus]